MSGSRATLRHSVPRLRPHLKGGIVAVAVEVEDQPGGVLADLTRRIARAGIDLDLVYVATPNRIVFGAADLAGLRAALN
jgi:hypothetical protein